MATSTCLLILSIFAAGANAYPLDNKQTNDTAAERPFRPVSLPTDFGSYDPDANGYIDLEELAKVSGTSLDDARKPFTDADIDDDDQVSPSEFERAPWSLNVFNREDVISEEDGEDDDEEEGGHVEDEIDDDEEGNMFDNADDILVDVSKLETEDEGKEGSLGRSSVETMEQNEDEKPEEPVEEEDDESRNIDTDEDETEEDEEEEEDEDSDAVDPLLDDDLLREETVLSEDEFVENAIY